MCRWSLRLFGTLLLWSCCAGLGFANPETKSHRVQFHGEPAVVKLVYKGKEVKGSDGAFDLGPIDSYPADVIVYATDICSTTLSLDKVTGELCSAFKTVIWELRGTPKIDFLRVENAEYTPNKAGNVTVYLNLSNQHDIISATVYAGDRSAEVEIPTTQIATVTFPPAKRPWWLLPAGAAPFLGIGLAWAFRKRPEPPAHDPNDPWVGQSLGGWILLEKIGEGGMATVYRARKNGQMAAIKRIHPGHDSDEFRHRFERELQVSVKLDHPNLVRLLEGSSADPAYLVMELIAGKMLRQLLPPLGFPAKEVLDFARQLCDGLSYAHQLGVVHRDLKPDNIMLTDSGVIKIADFGLARSREVQTLTATGQAVGTPHYMPPEQLMDKVSKEALDPRTDQYALAATLFEMFSGRPLFEGPDVISVITQHLNRPAPSILELCPGLPVALDHALQRALAKDPARRFASVEEFSKALQACRSSL